MRTLFARQRRLAVLLYVIGLLLMLPTEVATIRTGSTPNSSSSPYFHLFAFALFPMGAATGKLSVAVRGQKLLDDPGAG
jgi:hypothetical protein